MNVTKSGLSWPSRADIHAPYNADREIPTFYQWHILIGVPEFLTSNSVRSSNL